MDAVSDTTRWRNGSSTRKPSARKSPKRKPVTRKGSVQDFVHTELRRRLMVGGFLPGQAITLRQLAHELGVSPMPVRAALSQLIAEGGLEMLPNRTVRVPRMTRRRLAELLAVRRALEGMATEQACRNIADAQRKELERLQAAAMKAIAAGDELRGRHFNQQFHFTLYRSAGSAVLMPIIEALWLQAGPFIMNITQSTPGPYWDGRYHEDLLSALRRRDSRAARRAIERDINVTRQYLLKTTLLERD